MMLLELPNLPELEVDCRDWKSAAGNGIVPLRQEVLCWDWKWAIRPEVSHWDFMSQRLSLGMCPKMSPWMSKVSPISEKGLSGGTDPIPAVHFQPDDLFLVLVAHLRLK
jgi:hypothetical protein